MKRHLLLSAALLAGSAFLSMAQTHKEGEEYYRAEQYDNAYELLQRNYNNAGTDKSMANYYLGMISILANQPGEAQSYFNKGIELNPENGYNYVGLGELQLKAGDDKAAKKYFDDARKKNKKDASIDIAIARAYYDVDATKYAKEITKMQEQARKDSPKEGGIAPTNIDIYLFEGDLYRDQRDWGKAGSSYEMAKNYNKDATEAYVKYGILFRDVRPSESIRLLKELLQVNPNSALGQRELAETYYEQNMYKEAADQYGKYVNNPNHFKKDETKYALLLFYNGDYEGGYNYATQLLKEDSSNFTAQRYQFINAAQLESKKDEVLPLAEKLYQTHIGDPTKKILGQIDYVLIGGALTDAGRSDEAQAVFEEAISTSPENPEYYRQLANVFINEEKYDQAADNFNKFIDYTKSPTYSNYNTAAAYNYYAGIGNKDNPDAANKYYGAAQKMAEAGNKVQKNAKSYKLLGDIARQTASESEAKSVAVPFYQESIAIVEDTSNKDNGTVNDNKEIYNYLGNYYNSIGDTATALNYYDKFLELDPGNEAMNKIVKGLRK